MSGTGTVAEGVRFSDGTVVLRWLGTYSSVVIWSSLDDAMAIHGHDGATRVVWDGVHPVAACAGEYCCIHNPSGHPLQAAQLNWRPDRGIMERICEHGIGHPDPDDLSYQERTGREVDPCTAVTAAAGW